jgi:hypothetical protein
MGHIDDETLRALNQEIARRNEAEKRRRRTFGEVRRVISTKFQDHRFVVVGSRLYFNKHWQNFIDFLIFYVQDVMGREWWQAELRKPFGEQNPIVRWRAHLDEVSKNQQPDPETNLVSAVQDGIISALLLLSYDLYILRDHSKLQDEVVKRLRDRIQFQGARYELYVAATFIRAGFEIAYEDESDTSRKHTEFIAKHKASGLAMSVEAKARQRQIRGEFEMASIRPPVRDLLLSAAEKNTEHPLVVSLELNLPPEDASQPPSWVPHVSEVVQEVAAALGRPAFALVIFTNRPHLYGEPGEPDPSRHVYAVWPSSSRLSDDIVDVLGEAAMQYGNIPHEFPES